MINIRITSVIAAAITSASLLLCSCTDPVSTKGLSNQKGQLQVEGQAAEMGQLADANETDMQELEPTQPEGTVSWFNPDPWSQAEAQEEMHHAMEDQ